MKTKLTDLLNIKYPIIQGGMAWVSESKLAASVSNAGGAGIIASAGRTVEWLVDEIRKCKEMTDKPFGVNLVLQDEDVEEKKAAIIKEGVSFVATGAGNPVPHIKDFKNANIKIIPVVPNLKLAKRVEKAGADAIVVEGLEAGGHIGKLTTMALLSQVVPEINIPVIIAGGITEKRAAKACFVMGADGVQMGSRFYASKECVANDKAKQVIIDAIDTDTITTGTGAHTVRGIKNKMTDKYYELIENNAPKEELTKLIKGSSKIAPLDGDVDNGFVQAGQSLTTIKEIKTCKEIIDEIVEFLA